MRTLLPMATEVLKDWKLFVIEDETDFTNVYLAKSGVKDEQGKLIAGHELWRKSITVGSMLCSKDEIQLQSTRRLRRCSRTCGKEITAVQKRPCSQCHQDLHMCIS